MSIGLRGYLVRRRVIAVEQAISTVRLPPTVARIVSDPDRKARIGVFGSLSFVNFFATWAPPYRRSPFCLAGNCQRPLINRVSPVRETDVP